MSYMMYVFVAYNGTHRQHLNEGHHCTYSVAVWLASWAMFATQQHEHVRLRPRIIILHVMKTLQYKSNSHHIVPSQQKHKCTQKGR